MTPAQTAVRELADAVGWLVASLMPGTAKPYRAPTLTPEKRAERDRLARLERLERSGIAPGESPAPFDLDVADLLSEILVAADELADVVSDAAKVSRLAAASSAFADPAPFLAHLVAYLPAVDVVVARAVEDRCDGLVFRAHAVLGLLGDGQLLDAVCPWCGGRSVGSPTGGGRTMRVRAKLPDGKRSVAGVDPTDVRWFVVCESVSCSPSEADCGVWLRGRPAWPLHTEGVWLADRLERAAAVKAS